MSKSDENRARADRRALLENAARQVRLDRERDNGLLSSAELCEKLGISRRTLVRWRKREDFPRPLKIGQTLRFKRPDVDEWIERQAG
jgi:excisionase family DNA binding protein